VAGRPVRKSGKAGRPRQGSGPGMKAVVHRF
jgi:hypothetical protein